MMTTPETPANVAEEAKSLYAQADYEAAANLFGRAADLYRTENAPLDAAEMENNRSVALLQHGDAKRALEAALGTPEIFAQAGDVRREGMAHGNIASAYEALGKVEEAISAYQKCADLLEQAGETEMRSMVMESLAWLNFRKMRMPQGLLDIQSSLQGVAKPSFKQQLYKAVLSLLRFTRR
jgi:tetratricopeptide (TPR) repeat protein